MAIAVTGREGAIWTGAEIAAAIGREPTKNGERQEN